MEREEGVHNTHQSLPKASTRYDTRMQSIYRRCRIWGLGGLRWALRADVKHHKKGMIDLTLTTLFLLPGPNSLDTLLDVLPVGEFGVTLLAGAAV